MRWLAIAGSIVVFGLVACGAEVGYDQRGGPAIAEAIRSAGSPLVMTVVYHPGDFVDTATIDVILVRGAGSSEARTLVCSVIRPALAAGVPPDSLGVDVWDAQEAEVLASDFDTAACPAGS
jgi:hypothetical protein